MWPRFTLEATLQASKPIGSWVYDGSVSTSQDRIAWGGIGESSPWSGAVSLFARDLSTEVWALEQSLAPDAAGEQFGVSVALFGDRLAVGATNVGGAYMGGVYIFNAAGPTSSPWLKRVLLRPPTGDANQVYGHSVALMADTLAVGAWGAGGGAGVVHTYTLDDDGSVKPSSHQALVPSDAIGSAAGAYFGWSVALSASGRRLLSGAVRADDVRGTAYLFSRASADPSAPWSETAKLSDDPVGAGGGGAPGDRYATSVAIQEEPTGGARFLVGSKHKSIGNASHNGAAFLYSQASLSAAVMEEALLVPPAGNTALNGGSLAFAGDVLVIGPYGAGCNPHPAGSSCLHPADTNKVYAYTGCSSGAPLNECNLTQILTPSDTDDASDRFGSALSLDTASGMLAISSPLSGANGSLYLYRWTMGPPPPSQPPASPSPRAQPPSGAAFGTNAIIATSASSFAGAILCAIAAWLVLRRRRVVRVSTKDVRLDTTSRSTVRA